MQYDELHQRYGNHIAKRIQVELSSSEFKAVVVDQLPNYLESRAEAAHRQYQSRVDNPFVAKKAKDVDMLYSRWRDAEDLAYLINIAEDVSVATRLAVANSHA